MEVLHQMSDFFKNLKNSFNLFVRNKDPFKYKDTGYSYYYREDRPKLTRGNERSIVNAIFNRIAMDVSAIDIRHVRLDDKDRFLYTIDSGLNNCLSLEANIDQTSRAFIHDVVISMLDEGTVAIVPIDTSSNPDISDSYNILTMRTAKILEWKPAHVRILVYNDKVGRKEEVLVPKEQVAIIESPLYSVINEPNSTMHRLMRKLSLLDVVDEQSSSGKLDLIIQLPYVIKSKSRMDQAELRRKQIEEQLAGSKYGIAYTDGTERITQLNRSLENNLLGQVEYLTNLLFSQLGITQTILDGTADEQTLLNYHNRTIEPILSAITLEMKRKFLTKTARTQKQSIEFFSDPFRLMPISSVAEIADKFTRNEIMSSNEVRQLIGMAPSQNPKDDELKNKNISDANRINTDANLNQVNEQATEQSTSDEENQNDWNE